VMWNLLKTGPSSCPTIHGMLPLFAGRHSPVRPCALLDDTNRLVWNTDRRHVYAITGMSRPSPPGRVRAHSKFFAKSNWFPRVPNRRKTRAHFLTARPRVAAHLLGLRKVRRRTMKSGRDKRTPVPSESDEALYSDSLNDPASIYLLVTKTRHSRLNVTHLKVKC
jgi:hypothetical protein